jgi:hypothetical protein
MTVLRFLKPHRGTPEPSRYVFAQFLAVWRSVKRAQ